MGASAARRGAAALVLAGGLGLYACGGGDQPPAPLATSPPITAGSGVTSPGTGTAGASSSSTPTAAGGSRTVLAPLGLNLRADHSKTAAVLGMLGQGTVLTVVAHTDSDGGWYQVRGATRTGWIIDDPRYTSPRQFTGYQSDARGFSALYPTSWTFAETAAAVTFQPQSGPQVISVVTAATLDAVGPPGRQGYTQRDSATVEVFGVTGVLRYYERTGATAAATGPPATTTGTPAATGSAVGETTRLAEIRLTIDATHAMRIDFDYATPADLPIFVDLYDSVLILAAAHTPAPATPSPSPAR